MKQVIAIIGPTGVGKTKLSIALAKHLNGEIINADSMQVYQGLDIGTAKVREEEKEGIVHHLFDICNIEEEYTIYQYQKDCRRIIEEIISRGKTPILVGGSGLYIKAALYDYQFQEEHIFNDCSTIPSEVLLDKIKEVDPSYKEHMNNRKRLVRAYNKILNGTYQKQKSKPHYPFLCIGLTMDRETLYDRINKRVEEMIEEGLEEEVRKFYPDGFSYSSLQTGIGYKEFLPYFKGEKSLQEVIEEIKKNSRHYAKRQYTFFHHQLEVSWIHSNPLHFEETIKEALQLVDSRKEK